MYIYMYIYIYISDSWKAYFEILSEMCSHFMCITCPVSIRTFFVQWTDQVSGRMVWNVLMIITDKLYIHCDIRLV